MRGIVTLVLCAVLPRMTRCAAMLSDVVERSACLRASTRVSISKLPGGRRVTSDDHGCLEYRNIITALHRGKRNEFRLRKERFVPIVVRDAE